MQTFFQATRKFTALPKWNRQDKTKTKKKKERKIAAALKKYMEKKNSADKNFIAAEVIILVKIMQTNFNTKVNEAGKKVQI